MNVHGGPSGCLLHDGVGLFRLQIVNVHGGPSGCLLHDGVMNTTWGGGVSSALGVMHLTIERHEKLKSSNI